MSDTPLDVVGNEWQRTYRKQEAHIKELEAELAKCRWHRAHEEADEEIDKQMKRALRAELSVGELEAELAKVKEQIKCVEIQRDGAVKRGIMVPESYHASQAELAQCREDLSAATADEVKFRNKWADATADNARLRAYCGDGLARSDYQTAADMRKHLEIIKADNARLALEATQSNAYEEKLEARVKELEAGLAKGNDALHENCQLRMTIERLRACLKRLEWTADGRCPVCGKPKSCGHRFDCWLAAEWKEGE